MSRICCAYALVTLRLLVNRDPQAVAQNEQKILEIKKQLHTAPLLYEALIVLPEDQGLFDRFKVEQQQYLQRQEQVMALSRQNQLEDAVKVVNGEMNHLADTMAGTLGELVTLNKVSANQAAALAQQVFSQSRIGVIGMIALTALITIGLAVLLTRSIVLPLAQSVRVAQGGRGDLTVEIPSRQGRASAPAAGAQEHAGKPARDHPAYFPVLQPAGFRFRGAQFRSSKRHPWPAPAKPGIEQAATAVNQMTRRGEVAVSAVATSQASRESDRLPARARTGTPDGAVD